MGSSEKPMSIFDRFKKKPAPSQDEPSLEQISYAVAYFVLPHYAFDQFEKIEELWEQTPNAAGPFMYLFACLNKDLEPDAETAPKFEASTHRFENRVCYALSYPPPRPIPSDFLDLPDDELLEKVASGQGTTLAPHFSCVMHELSSGKKTVYNLGQSFDGGTTLRQVSREMNANLGPGPAPDLDAFLEAINQLGTDGGSAIAGVSK